MPNIGYGSAKRTKHIIPSGFRKVVVKNVRVSVALYLFKKITITWDY